MKKCPNCQRTFDDAMNFCQFDAATLIPAAGGEDLPPTVVGFQMPPTQAVSGNQFEKPTHPQMPAFQTSQPTPQFQMNQPAPNFNPPIGFSGAAQNQPAKRPGNRWAMAGLGFMIAACVLTVIAAADHGFWGFGSSIAWGSISPTNIRIGFLPMLTIFVTFVALAFAGLALLLGIIKSAFYGRKVSAITVLLVSVLLLGVQLILTGSAYSEASTYSYNYNSNTNTADYGTNNPTNINNNVSNRNGNVSTAPVTLQTAIIGTWRDSVGATATFYANKTLVINDRNGKKIADADYEITGSNKLAMIKNGVRVKEYSVSVSGNRMTMDGETMTKVY